MPGSTIQALLKERLFLSEWSNILKRRVQLDEEYIQNLEAFSQSVAMYECDSDLLPLVSPLMEYFEREIVERKKAASAMHRHLDTVSTIVSDDGLEDLQKIITKCEQARGTYTQYQICYQRARTPVANATVELWEKGFSEAHSLKELDDGAIRDLVIPELEREYRQSLNNIQQEASEISDWNAEELPGVIHSHQERLGNFKEMASHLLGEYSEFCAHLSTHLVCAKENVDQASTSEIIAHVYQKLEVESQHPILRSITYDDFQYRTRRKKVVFGIEQSLDLALNVIPLVDRPVDANRPPASDQFFDSVFDIERKFDRTEDNLDIARGFEDWEMRSFIRLALLTNPPLVKLRDGTLNLWQGGIPRDKIANIMERSIAQYGKRIELLFRPGGAIWRDKAEQAMLLTHRWGTAKIVSDIWRKWDFENHRPLPKGVERDSR
ncbi:hypothetical protein CPB86DRAFT_817211 [Serendipita vermifera]|nr:hypothetical protein CPB86DRAFT_817211 [Serendipita vermifera]